ncbi:Multiple organellar RNA editing factor 1, mitochondrial [Linum grandiflorum]
MALQLLRLRRAVTSLSAAHRSFSSSIIPLPTQTTPRILPYASPDSSSPKFPFSQSRGFKSSRVSLAGERRLKLYQEGDEITEDTVLFEGCDFNHWLITVDFPKDPAPSPEEMVATYERICAEGLGISIEEAKQKMYACSTTTYQGFQAIMTEEESEKFKEVPGVVFVLPDSYIDPVNKEYGGDKYENGVITHRPPPVQYRRPDRSRQQGSRRYGQQGYNQSGNPQYQQQGNPQYNQPRNPQFNQQGNPDFRQQGYPQHQQRGPMQGDSRNNGPPQNFPSQQQFNAPPPQNYPQQSFGAQGQQNFGAPRNNYGSPHQNFGTPPNNYGTPQQNYPPPAGQIPLNRRDSQGQQGNYYPPAQGGSPGGEQKNDGPPGQRDPRGDGGNYGGTYGQGANVGTGHGYPGQGQGFPQMGQRNPQEGRGDYSPLGQPGTDQVRGGRY